MLPNSPIKYIITLYVEGSCRMAKSLLSPNLWLQNHVVGTK